MNSISINSNFSWIRIAINSSSHFSSKLKAYSNSFLSETRMIKQESSNWQNSSKMRNSRWFGYVFYSNYSLRSLYCNKYPVIDCWLNCGLSCSLNCLLQSRCINRNLSIVFSFSLHHHESTKSLTRAIPYAKTMICSCTNRERYDDDLKLSSSSIIEMNFVSNNPLIDSIIFFSIISSYISSFSSIESRKLSIDIEFWILACWTNCW